MCRSLAALHEVLSCHISRINIIDHTIKPNNIPYIFLSLLYIGFFLYGQQGLQAIHNHQSAGLLEDDR